MQFGGGEQCADGNITVGDIEMHFIAVPVAQMAFAAFLDAQTAIAEPLGEYVFLLQFGVVLRCGCWVSAS